jgi:hypothetical protein
LFVSGESPVSSWENGGMSATRRVVLGASLVACALFMALGVELWSTVLSDVHTREPVPSPACAGQSGSGFIRTPCPIVGYESVATGSAPNHLPATTAFVFGGATGALVLILAKPRQMAKTQFVGPTAT